MPWRRAVDPHPEHGEGRGVVRFELDGSFPGFHGHFPGRPVLPAVAILALAVEAKTLLSPDKRRVRAVGTAKFRRPVAPGALLDVECAPADDIVWSVRVLERGVPVAVIDLEFS
jgi:3-hydroxyacyl-[acyl-carrier-protein] dehydratase